MDKAIIALNGIVAEGVISDYAIGGAIGAAFYIEAAQTQDVDVFVFMKPEPNGLLSLSPIYAALVAKGGIVKDEHIVIDGWPIQVLPAYKPLVEEALSESIPTTFNNIPTRVFSPEYACAIALDTGRGKDFLRVSAFIEQGQVDLRALWKLAEKYNLKDVLIKKVSNWPGVQDDHAPK
jgi:hypothetical protein